MGTMDHTSHLSVVAAAEYRESRGGEKEITKQTSLLAEAGGRRVSDIWEKTEVLYSKGLSMINVALPITPNQDNEKRMSRFMLDLLERHDCACSVYKHREKYWVRLSAQLYNDMSHFEQLAYIVLKELEPFPMTTCSVN